MGSEPLLCPAEFMKHPFEWSLRSEGTAKSWGPGVWGAEYGGVRRREGLGTWGLWRSYLREVSESTHES